MVVAAARVLKVRVYLWRGAGGIPVDHLVVVFAEEP